MPAVVAPVGINHADFGDRGITVFCVTEILLTECDVIEIHCQRIVIEERLSACLVECTEAVECFNGCGNGIVGIEGIYGIEGSLTALDRVNEIALEFFEFRIGNCAGDDIDAGVSDAAAFFSVENLDTLFTGIRSLVELTGEIFDSKNALLIGEQGQLFVDVIDCRLRKDGRDCAAKFFFGDMVGVVAVEHTNTNDIQPKCCTQVGEHGLCLHSKLGLFFCVDAINCHNFFNLRKSYDCTKGRPTQQSSSYESIVTHITEFRKPFCIFSVKIFTSVPSGVCPWKKVCAFCRFLPSTSTQSVLPTYFERWLRRSAFAIRVRSALRWIFTVCGIWSSISAALVPARLEYGKTCTFANPIFRTKRTVS